MEPINWHSFFFLLFALIACGFAVAVVVSTNIVRMAFYLMLSLAATAGLFFLAGAEFVGAMQLLIYVGGTLVLLIFGVMLTAQARFISMKTSRGEMGIAAARRRVPVCWLAGCGRRSACRSGSGLDATNRSPPSRCEPTATPIGLGLLGVRVDGDRCAPTAPGYLLALRNHLGAPAGRADRRGLPGPRKRKRSVIGRMMSATLMSHPVASLLTEPVGVAHYLRRRRRAVRVRRALHGDEAERAGRADGHRAGAQRGEHEFHRLRQPVFAERRGNARPRRPADGAVCDRAGGGRSGGGPGHRTEFLQQPRHDRRRSGRRAARARQRIMDRLPDTYAADSPGCCRWRRLPSSASAIRSRRCLACACGTRRRSSPATSPSARSSPASCSASTRCSACGCRRIRSKPPAHHGEDAPGRATTQSRCSRRAATAGCQQRFDQPCTCRRKHQSRSGWPRMQDEHAEDTANNTPRTARRRALRRRLVHAGRVRPA